MTDDLEMRGSRSISKAQDYVPATVSIEIPDLIGEHIIPELALKRDIFRPESDIHLIHGSDSGRRQNADGAFQYIPTIMYRRNRIRGDEEERAAARACA